MRVLSGIGLIAVLMAVGGCEGEKAAQAPDPKADIEVVETIKEGTGRELKDGDIAFILYRGTFIPESKEGAPAEPFQFDTNMDDVTNQTPMRVFVNAGGMIPGFDKAVANMKVGEHVKVSIPWELGYGSQGNPPKIPPYQDLTFEIQLLYAFSEDEKEVFDIESDTDGTGTAAKPGDTVEIHYKGTYLTGKVWDDTRQRGKTVQFKLGDRETVIPGINAGMGGIPESGVNPMKVGGKRTIVIPHTLAFGAGGSQSIEGYQPLRIEIELVSVNGQK